MPIKYIRRKSAGIKTKLTDLLRDGLSHHKLSMAIAAGIVLGSFPLLIPGVTSLLCVSFALLFGLNVGLIQLVNLTCSPLQLILYLPFVKAGKVMFHVPGDISWGNLILQFKHDFWGTIQFMGILNLAGIVAWCVFAIGGGYILYRISLSLVMNIRPSQNQ